MKNFFKKYKKNILIVFSIIIFIILILTIYYMISNNSEIEVINLDTDNYTLQYNTTWKITIQEDSEFEILHKKSNSTLNIKIKELDEELQYESLDEIFEIFLYNFQEQNEDYNLLYKEKTTITENEIEGYKVLFENNETQVAIYLYKQDTNMVIFTYESLSEYFDILLDDVNSVIYSFNLTQKSFDIETEINLNMSEIKYTEQEDIVEQLSDTADYEISSSNYKVNYSLPSNFKENYETVDYGSYTFDNLSIGTSIYIYTYILNCNLYEYLDEDNSPNLYDNYVLSNYDDVDEAINRYLDNPLSYIYKNSYLNNNKITENFVIIYELNNNHIFIVKISSTGIGIPEELIQMIKINKIENVANN